MRYDQKQFDELVQRTARRIGRQALDGLQRHGDSHREVLKQTDPRWQALQQSFERRAE